MSDKATVAATGFWTPPSPRLSIDLTGPVQPDRCQACGRQAIEATTLPDQLSRWQEHDDADRPERIVVVLCERCASKIIEPHPRLYRRLSRFHPWPGCMDICLDCRFREGNRCTNPNAKANGGEGVILTMPKPTTMHILACPRRNSGWHTNWNGPVSACKQKEIAGAPAKTDES